MEPLGPTFLERIPKGFRHKAQGCEERATLGKDGRCFTTPTGLWPGCAAVAVGRNPFRVVIDPTHDPRVARSSQPFIAESLRDSSAADSIPVEKSRHNEKTERKQ